MGSGGGKGVGRVGGTGWAEWEDWVNMRTREQQRSISKQKRLFQNPATVLISEVCNSSVKPLDTLLDMMLWLPF